MCSVLFDFRPQLGVPQADGAVLASSEDILRCALCISDNVNRPFMSVERGVEVARYGRRSARRRHGGR